MVLGKRQCGVMASGVAAMMMWLFIGCSSEPADGTAITSDRPEQAGTSPDVPPVAAISELPADRNAHGPSKVSVQPGSPEAKLLEISKLVAAANAEADRQAAADETEGPDFNPSGVDGESPTAAYRYRLEQIIELATQVIAATHLDPQQEQSFNNAVHYLSDARLELASTGDTQQAQLLIEDAESLFERDRESFAAAEAGFKVVELAERMAAVLGSEDADWLKEYATQARIFAQRFPGESSRAGMALFQSGRLCDRFGLAEQAHASLKAIMDQFPESVFAEQSAGILRRLSIEGQPLELAGETIDGGFLEADQYRGRIVLLVFWAASSPTFAEDLPVIRQIEREFSPRGLSVVGVNLDVDEAEVDRFLAEHDLSWPQLFSSDPHHRGGRHPIVRYYGVQVVPSYWLINREGIVTSAGIPAADLPNVVAEHMRES